MHFDKKSFHVVMRREEKSPGICIGRFPSDGAVSVAVTGLNTLNVTSILTVLLGSHVILYGAI